MLGDFMKVKMIMSLVVVSIIFFITLGCVNINDFNDNIIGGQLDEYGCLSSAGYSFDEEIGACVRQWELNEETRQLARTAVVALESERTPVIISIVSFDCDGCYIVEIADSHTSQQENKIIKIQNNVVVEDFEMNNVGIPTEEDYQIEFSYDSVEQKVFYSIVIDAPRSCDSFEIVNMLFLESYPVQVVINLRLIEADMMCAEVMTPVNIDGEFELDHEPGSIRVVVEKNGFNDDSEQNLDKVYCTLEQKNAEFCTMEYAPVIGDNGIEYGNKCVACSSGEIEYYILSDALGDVDDGSPNDPIDDEIVCPMIWAPVCGVNGETFSNSCFAEAEGIEIAYEGECDKQEFICTPEQKEVVVCYMLYAPVCGNNGVTYGNDCIACSSGEIDSYVMGEC
jgi:hypothetical protein